MAMPNIEHAECLMILPLLLEPVGPAAIVLYRRLVERESNYALPGHSRT